MRGMGINLQGYRDPLKSNMNIIYSFICIILIKAGKDIFVTMQLVKGLQAAAPGKDSLVRSLDTRGC